MIEAGDVLDRSADEAAIENIRAADGLSFGIEPGVGLYAAGNPVIACAPSVSIGMDRDIAAAGIETDCAI